MCTTLTLGVRAPTVVHYSSVTLALCVKKYLVQGLLELTGLLSGPLSLKCGGDTERDHSARDNETAERSPKAKVRLGYDVRDDWIYKYM